MEPTEPEFSRVQEAFAEHSLWADVAFVERPIEAVVLRSIESFVGLRSDLYVIGSDSVVFKQFFKRWFFKRFFKPWFFNLRFKMNYSERRYEVSKIATKMAMTTF